MEGLAQGFRCVPCVHGALLLAEGGPLRACPYRFGYINWMWYGWGALMINQYEHSALQIYGTPILEYYSLNGIDKYAFIGYCSLTFVFFFLVAYLVRATPLDALLALSIVFLWLSQGMQHVGARCACRLVAA